MTVTLSMIETFDEALASIAGVPESQPGSSGGPAGGAADDQRIPHGLDHVIPDPVSRFHGEVNGS